MAEVTSPTWYLDTWNMNLHGKNDHVDGSRMLPDQKSNSNSGEITEISA